MAIHSDFDIMKSIETIKDFYGLHLRFLSANISGTVGIPPNVFEADSEITLVFLPQPDNIFNLENAIFFSIKGMYLELNDLEDFYYFFANRTSALQFNPSFAWIDLGKYEELIKIGLLRDETMWERGSKAPFGILLHFSSGLRLIIHINISLPEKHLVFSFDMDYIDRTLKRRYMQLHTLNTDGSIIPPWDPEFISSFKEL
jgi:hypothetical protein